MISSHLPVDIWKRIYNGNLKVCFKLLFNRCNVKMVSKRNADLVMKYEG